jgi:FixJ family two-component response regulator
MLMQDGEPVVFVVDEDEALREAIRQVADMMNLRCEAFHSGLEFLGRFDRGRPGCVVTELRVPGASGLQILRRLAEEGARIPIIFVSAYGTLAIAVRAMREGAFHFLEKPVHEQEIWDAIQAAVTIDQQRIAADHWAGEVREKLRQLSFKEAQVLRMIAQGKSNLMITEDLDISIRTVELRRATLMKKLHINRPEDLMRFAVLACNGCDGGNGHSKQSYFQENLPALTPSPAARPR